MKANSMWKMLEENEEKKNAKSRRARLLTHFFDGSVHFTRDEGASEMRPIRESAASASSF